MEGKKLSPKIKVHMDAIKAYCDESGEDMGALWEAYSGENQDPSFGPDPEMSESKYAEESDDEGGADDKESKKALIVALMKKKRSESEA